MKIRSFVSAALLAAACTFGHFGPLGQPVRAATLPVPEQLISLGSDLGAQLLIDSQSRRAYWPLSLQFVTQKNQSFCGVATLAMVLNALEVPAPATPGIDPFTTFTQDNLLSDRTDPIVTVQTVLERGMTLDQVGGLLAAYAVPAEVRHAGASSPEQFRESAAAYLGQPGGHVIVNYLRRAIGQERGGHISALAAYERVTDRFLVLDVSRYKYPPVWVRSDDLFAAMNTTDADNQNRTRGYVLVGKLPVNSKARAADAEPAAR
jgi:hypothetical protein